MHECLLGVVEDLQQSKDSTCLKVSKVTLLVMQHLQGWLVFLVRNKVPSTHIHDVGRIVGVSQPIRQLCDRLELSNAQQPLNPLHLVLVLDQQIRLYVLSYYQTITFNKANVSSISSILFSPIKNN